MDEKALEKIIESSRYEFLIERKEEINSVLTSLLRYITNGRKEDFEVIYKFFHILKGASGILNENQLSEIALNMQEILDEKESESFLDDQTIIILVKNLGEVLNLINQSLEKHGDKNISLAELQNNDLENSKEGQTKPHMEGEKKRDLKQKKILVVDDVALIVNLIKTRLSYLGYEIEHAKDGEEALEKISLFKPDLVLLDIMLPKLTGIEVLKRMKQKESLKGTKVIMLSAKSKDKDVLDSIRIGANDFITKPFSLEVLEEKIKLILQN